MRLPLRFFSVLLLGLGLLVGRPAWASHIVGGDISYRPLGNNQYEVTVIYFRDCSGITLPQSLNLDCTPSCNGTAISSTLFPILPPVVPLPPYCASVIATFSCNASSPLPGYEYQSYQGVVMLPHGQWLLGVEDNARPSTANLTAQTDFRFEATLDNSTGLSNTSAVFNHSSVYYLPWQRRTTVQMGAFDADGDSLVYELDNPLVNCGSPNIYRVYPGSACQTTTVAGCTYTCAANATGTTYTATRPIAVLNDTIGTFPAKTLVPRFTFNPVNGGIEVEPANYFNTSPINGDNKYVAVIKVSEYRRIGGTYRLVGSVRRDLMFTVYFCGANQLPRMNSTMSVQQGPMAPITQQSLTQEIPALAGEPVTVNLTGSDPNIDQLPSFNLVYNTVPGVQLLNNGSGAARVTFTPPYTLPAGLYHVTVNFEDNACPVKGSEVRTLSFRVTSSSTLAARSSRALAIAAWPTPFTDVVQFQLPQAGAQALTICDQLGRVVARLHSQADGLVRWQPGTEVPAGLYLARTSAGQTVRLLRSASK